MTKQKRVSFSMAQTRFFEQPSSFPSDSDGALQAASITSNASLDSVVNSPTMISPVGAKDGCTTTSTTSLEELKVYRWYTSEELNASREDARRALHALQAVNGRMDLVDSSKFCIRGMEQYVDVVSKVRRQQLLKRSVLDAQHQSTSSEEEECPSSVSLKTTSSSGSLASTASSSSTSSSCSTGEEVTPQKRRACPEKLAAMSRYLSQASRDLAHHFAVLNAQETLRSIGEPSALTLPTTSPQNPAPTSPIVEADPVRVRLPTESPTPSAGQTQESKKRRSPSLPSLCNGSPGVLPDTGSPKISHGFCRYVKVPRLQ